MGSAMGQALAMIVSTLGSLLIGAVVVRFLLQAAKADFYNPISQSLVKITNPFVLPLRKLIPGYGGFDIAALVAAYLLSVLATALLSFFLGGTLPAPLYLLTWPLVGLVSMILNIYFWGLIILIIASWIAPMSSNPVLLLVFQLMQPIQSRVRGIIPPLGMIDISPIFIILGINVVRIVLVDPVAVQLGLFPQLVIGI